ncbi:hypothetical protein NQX30_05645 [Candidatus Persebacteraceae bacterium Df01]|jgi:hypothetical protein|uniref:Secreted protein n=1 Tax=Candidatus Doriopsillibacter californiensis TaxID=2970740 RepID=A0ABT7QMN9_9GAMM|nr:hypothetical protein [Candidatus Persebacteraceae bacterium Df01]
MKAKSENGKKNLAAAAAAFGLAMAAEPPPQKSFKLWRGVVRSVSIFNQLPDSVWRHYFPPMGGNVLLLGLDWAAVAALLSLRCPRIAGTKMTTLLDDLTAMEAVTVSIRNRVRK